MTYYGAVIVPTLGDMTWVYILMMASAGLLIFCVIFGGASARYNSVADSIDIPCAYEIANSCQIQHDTRHVSTLQVINGINNYVNTLHDDFWLGVGNSEVCTWEVLVYPEENDISITQWTLLQQMQAYQHYQIVDPFGANNDSMDSISQMHLTVKEIFETNIAGWFATLPEGMFKMYMRYINPAENWPTTLQERVARTRTTYAMVR